MKTLSAKLFATVTLIITVTLACTPRAVAAEPEIVAWGYNDQGQTNVPSGLNNVVAIAAGKSHSLALTAEGRLVVWGSYYQSPAYIPATVPNGLSDVVAMAVGGYHTLALTAEGRVVGWGTYWEEDLDSYRSGGCAHRLEQCGSDCRWKISQSGADGRGPGGGVGQQ